MSSEKKKNKVDLSKHWFWGIILQNKGVYTQVMLASIFINIFGFVSAFYIMTVYDRVLPNYAINSLIALTIGMGVVIVFDFILHFLPNNGDLISRPSVRKTKGPSEDGVTSIVQLPSVVHSAGECAVAAEAAGGLAGHPHTVR